MSMEEDFLQVLKRNGDLVSLVGNRISLDKWPQSFDEPAIIVSRITGGHEHQLSGSAGYAMPIMHVMCFARPAPLANRLRDTVRLALQGFSGIVGQTRFMSVMFIDETHSYEPDTDANDRGSFGRLLSFDVQYEELIPTFS